MAIDIQSMKHKLEAKRDELKSNISGLTEAHPAPTDPIEASEGPQDFEEVAVDFLEIQNEQSLLVAEFRAEESQSGRDLRGTNLLELPS